MNFKTNVRKRPFRFLVRRRNDRNAEETELTIVAESRSAAKLKVPKHLIILEELKDNE